MADEKRYFIDHGMWHDRKTGRHLEDIAEEVRPSQRALHLLNALADHNQTDEEARAELERDGVDIEAFLRKVRAAVDQYSVVGDWCWHVVKGSGGFHAYERHELPVYDDRDLAIAEFVIRALANPKCEDSDRILDAIIARRKEQA